MDNQVLDNTKTIGQITGKLEGIDRRLSEGVARMDNIETTISEGQARSNNQHLEQTRMMMSNEGKLDSITEFIAEQKEARKAKDSLKNEVTAKTAMWKTLIKYAIGALIAAATTYGLIELPANQQPEKQPAQEAPKE